MDECGLALVRATTGSTVFVWFEVCVLDVGGTIRF